MRDHAPPRGYLLALLQKQQNRCIAWSLPDLHPVLLSLAGGEERGRRVRVSCQSPARRLSPRKTSTGLHERGNRKIRIQVRLQQAIGRILEILPPHLDPSLPRLPLPDKSEALQWHLGLVFRFPALILSEYLSVFRFNGHKK